MTLAQLRTRAAAFIGSDDTAAGTDELLVDSFANAAVRDILRRTRVYISKSTVTLTAAVNEERLDSTVMKITGAFVTAVDGTVGQVVLTDPDEILRLRRTSAAGGSTYQLALQGSDLLMIWPTPAAADVITFYYVARPSEMSSGAHDPSVATYGGIPVEYHEAILWYVLARLADYDDDSSSTQGDRYRKLYDEELVKIRYAMNTKLGRQTRITIPGHTSRQYGLRPDQVRP